MTIEHWLIVVAVSGVNLTTLVGGLIHITTKLARIETDIKWIKSGCPNCQPTLEDLTK